MANGKNTRQENVRDDIKRSLEEADTRDVFERALDVVSPAAGAYLGGVVGAKLGEKIGNLAGRKQYKKWRKSRDFDALDKWSRRVAASEVTGASLGALSGSVGGLALRAETAPKRWGMERQKQRRK
jgi:uncharacterized protein YcfJ